MYKEILESINVKSNFMDDKNDGLNLILYYVILVLVLYFVFKVIQPGFLKEQKENDQQEINENKLILLSLVISLIIIFIYYKSSK